MPRDTQPRPTEAHVRQIVEAKIRERFSIDEAPMIVTEFVEDDDGSEWIKVSVIYGRAIPPASKTLPIGGDLRRKLLAAGETAFPLVSFASEADFVQSNETGADL